jgi:hypothetical protein
VGNLNALDFADAVKGKSCSLRAALEWHLSSNHYPPIPLSLVPVCERAIKYASKGKWEANVRLPYPVLYRGAKSAPVWAVVEQHHLDAFIERNGE